MEVKTKSGFKCEVNERKLKDWRFVRALAKCESEDQLVMLDGISFIVPFLFGKDGEERLMTHLEKDGIVESDAVFAELKDVLEQMGEELKKS